VAQDLACAFGCESAQGSQTGSTLRGRGCRERRNPVWPVAGTALADVGRTIAAD